MAKKKDSVEAAAEQVERNLTFNPLLNALRENDKKNLFKTNVTTAFIKTGFPLFDYYFGAVINIHDELGKIIKQEARVGQAVGTFNLFIGITQSGKAQPITTPIPTPDGWTTIGELKIGDKVFTHNGKVTTIDGVFPQGLKDIYKITFSDGRTAMCCEDHLWRVAVHSHGKDNFMVTDVKTMLKHYKNKSGISRYRIQTLMNPVQYNHRDVPIDPYTLGALIGNGALKERYVTISGTYEVPEKIAKIHDWIPHKNSKNNYSWTFYGYDGSLVKTEDFFEELPELIGSISSNKRIPEIYLHNDVETRMELLRGLMDTDGSITYANGLFSVTYSSCSIGLLKDIQELVRSLGYTCNISEDKRKEKYRNGFHGTLSLQIPNNFKPEIFTVGHKALIAIEAGKFSNRRHYEYITIKNIEFDHVEEAQCIHVTDPSHLYVTDQFIITHNTTWVSQIAANIIRQFPYSNVIHYDCEYRFDISRAESITKLPSYFFDGSEGPERYMIKTGAVGFDTIQEMVVKTYVAKMKLKKELMVDSGYQDEFGRPVMILQPTVIIIDSMTTVMNETFSYDSTKEASDAEKMRGNTEGARDAKTMKGFFKDILPLCKEANIIIFGINHINTNMSMNAFVPVAKQQNYLKQDEIIPGGKTMVYYPFNIVKLTPRPSDDFTEESDGFAGHIVMVEPIKSSSNQSGNNSKGISFEMVFSFKQGFDSLRSLLMYGREYGIIEGNKNRMKFRDDDSFTFNMKNIYQEINEKPIWENIKKYIIPHLDTHLSYIEPSNITFDDRSLDY